MSFEKPAFDLLKIKSTLKQDFGRMVEDYISNVKKKDPPELDFILGKDGRALKNPGFLTDRSNDKHLNNWQYLFDNIMH